MNDQQANAVQEARRTARRHRLRRWILGGVAIMALPFLAAGAVLAWLTTNPRIDSVPRVDALLVLSTESTAHDEARRLARRGVTDLLIVSAPTGVDSSLCEQPPADVEVQCFSPQPVTTQGEAMGGASIAHEHDVHSLGVLTFDHHIERSRMLVDRCWHGDLYMYEFQSVRGLSARSFVYAMAAYGKVFLTPDCATPPPQWLQTPIDWIKD